MLNLAQRWQPATTLCRRGLAANTSAGHHHSTQRIIRPCSAHEASVQEAAEGSAIALQQARRAIAAVGHAAVQKAPQKAVTGGSAEAVLQRAMRNGQVLSKDAQDAIRARIEQKMRHKAAQETFLCPACAVEMRRLDTLQAHVARCCPDIVDMDELQTALLNMIGNQLPASATAQLRQLLQQASEQEAQLRAKALQIVFVSGSQDSSSDKLKRGAETVAQQLSSAKQLPLDRCERLLRAALKSIPLVADPEPLDILYEDDHIIAINKPPGLNSTPTHRYKGGSVVNRLVGHFGDGRVPYVLHRLDHDTSGLMLFGKHAAAVPPLARQFRERTLQKSYLAIVVGIPQQSNFVVDAPIGPHPTSTMARSITSEGKPALTSFQVLASSPLADLSRDAQPGECFDAKKCKCLKGAALVRCMPHTGRTHQIRLHLAHAGHPIIGDEMYGLTGPWMGRQALHAWSLEFEHPVAKDSRMLAASVPPDFRGALQLLGLSVADVQA